MLLMFLHDCKLHFDGLVLLSHERQMSIILLYPVQPLIFPNVLKLKIQSNTIKAKPKLALGITNLPDVVDGDKVDDEEQ